MSRNAIKYQPFSALDGYFDSIDDKNEDLNDIQRPIPSEDDCIRINDTLTNIINDGLVGVFHVYKNKRIYLVESRVEKVLNKVLYLENCRVEIKDIVNVTIL